MSPDRQQGMLRLIETLDLAISRHTVWLKNLHLSLICGGAPVNPHDTDADAHRLCLFGRWYYDEGRAQLSEFEAAAQIEQLHHEMHDSARRLLLHTDRNRPVCSEDYEHFIELAIRFKSRVRALQSDFISRVCTVDQLTGAWNRHEMFNRLNQEYERNRRMGAVCSLVMMDVDHFKRINDEFGHRVGDEVLKQLVSLCSGLLRTYDAVFRYGGEEFLFCFPGSDTGSAVGMVERLRETINRRSFVVGNGMSLNITASFGIATLSGEKSLDDTMLEADHALLAAKNTGRNRYCVWGS